MRYGYYYHFPIGKIGIVEENNYITNISLEINNFIEKETEQIKKCKQELLEYFQGKRKIFSKIYYYNGTSFQNKVWKELENILYGETLCYQDIALKINNPKAQRAVGMANNKNPLMIIIPCHRVIHKNKNINGYAYGKDIKEYLLNLEKNN